MFGPVTDAAAGGQEGEKGGGKKNTLPLRPSHLVSLAEPSHSGLATSSISISILHALKLLFTNSEIVGPSERSLIEQFVDEDGVIILYRLYCIVFSPLLVGYLDVLTQRQTNSDILKTPFSHPFLASFTSTLFHLLSFVMLSYETITKQQTLSFSKGHKSTGPLGKEFKSKFDLPFVFKSPTNSHKAQSASESLTLASPPLRLFNPRQSLRMSIVRQPTPATPQQFTAGRSTPPLDDSLPEEISGDMRLAFVQHPATRFESDDSDPEPPPPPENEEWESDVLLPSPPQTMPTLTQRRRRMFLVSVQIITHSLSLLIPPVCDDFMQLLNLGTNRASPNEKASEERIVDPTQIPNPSTLSVALDSTQQFTFDMSTAGTRYNNIIQSYAESTANGNNADYRRTQPSSELNLERRHQRGRSKSSEDEDVVGVEGAGLPRKRHEADARPVVDVDHPNTVALAFEAMRALHVNSIPEIPRAFKTQLVKNSGNFYAWHVGQDETAKTKFPIRKGKLQLEADRLGTHAQLC
ncbi:hypothetical protein BLNAU_18115 [Blattamonas nauphoetae]|uniref:Uncharacterized protein n=1 Tax=Blattamonas nauphoetae TaxID=2049346 RepID=A0ABQ9X5H0_9EUKA|nr:hypothetical protein BLNAU_18115 [Blattamonas nauphoetae]